MTITKEPATESTTSASSASSALSVGAQVRYTALATITPAGIARSQETTIFAIREGDGGDGGDGGDEEPLDAAVMRAAQAYLGCVRSMSCGLMGGLDSRPQDDPTIYLRPVGYMLMGFSELVPTGVPGEVSMRVERGLLCSRHASPEHMGELIFRWRRVGGQEIFETEVRDFTPMWMGACATRVRRGFYMLTQMALHRLVMWRYHVWVRRERDRLLLEDP